MEMKKLLVLISVLLSVHLAMAQREVTLLSLSNVYQATYVNPADTPQSKVHVGLRGLSSIYFGISMNRSTMNTSCADILILTE